MAKGLGGELMDYLYEEWRQREFAERFGVAMDTWRFQVDSYWTRNSYFAVFETGALASLWFVFREGYNATCIAGSVIGCILTVVWLFNNSRGHSYVSYWWDRLKAIEKEFEVNHNRRLVRGYNKRRGGDFYFKYSGMLQVVPCLFMASWLWLIGLSGWTMCHQHITCYCN
jgi:hypothetical protein